MQIETTDALLIVDVQNTFCPGGTLPVSGGDRVVPVINVLVPLFTGRVYASQDWHPVDHCSFVAQGGVWQPHAVQNTQDAALHSDLDTDAITRIVQKGTRSDRDAYSAFDGTELTTILRDAGMKRVFVTGLATDYCVKASALDAVAAGFDVAVVTDAVAGVEVSPGDTDTAISAMENAGVRMVASADLSPMQN